MPRLMPLLLVLSLSWSAQAGDKLIPLTPAQRAALRVATAPVTAHAGAITVGLPALVAVPPAQERGVAAPLAGFLTAVNVAAGDVVRPGQALAVLRGESLGGAQRELLQAGIETRLAEESARRDEALFQEGIVAESRLQTSRANLARARAGLAERRAWLRLLGLSAGAIQAAERGERLSDSITLVAPQAGVVLEQAAMVGSRVEAGALLFKIARLDPLWLEIQAPAEVASLVKTGQKVSVPGSRSSGVVVAVGRVVSAAQTVAIRARVNNPDGHLRLNQSVAARIEDVAGAKQWRVPVKAVLRHAGRNWVFVERPGGFEPEPVKVLSQTSQAVAIDAAFFGEEKIAVEGVAALKAMWQGEGK